MSSNNRGVSEIDAVFRDFIVEQDGERRLEVDVDGRRHTVPLRDPYPYEIDLVNDLIEPQTDTSVSGNAQPIKGKWIEGWLTVNEDDYINNIFKNYQFFLKYLEARTEVIQNISTHKRSPGTYDSMYRYLLLLEDLGLVERHRREEVPEDEYDFPVPDEFRTRTYIKKTSDYEDRRDSWENPYEALYGSSDSGAQRDVDEVDIPEDTEPEDTEPDQPEVDEDEAVDIDVEPRDDSEDPSGLEGFIEPGEGGPTDIEPEEDDDEPQSSGLDEMTESDVELPAEDASIADFPERQNLFVFIEQHFDDAVEAAINNSPVPVDQLDPDDLSLGRVGVFGPWAEGEAQPGQDELSLVASIDDTSAQASPGFIPPGVQQAMSNILNQDNPYPEVFPSYEVVSVYNSAFSRKIDEVVRQTQTDDVYYNLTEDSVESL